MRVPLIDGRRARPPKKKSNPIKNYTRGEEEVEGERGKQKKNAKSRQRHATTCTVAFSGGASLPSQVPGWRGVPQGVDVAAGIFMRLIPLRVAVGGGAGAWRNFSMSPRHSRGLMEEVEGV